jgi:uncharacterized glyoxalase superfamily metalloenzyme YdcJ
MKSTMEQRRHSLEESFFQREDAKLIARLKELREREDKRRALMEASGIQNPEVLDKLIALNMQPETVAALALIPLIEVAWADGAVEAGERTAMLQAIEARGEKLNPLQHELFERWLQRRPAPELFAAWEHYAGEVLKQLPPAQRQNIRQELLARARTVAEAAGGFLGFGKISSDEEAVLRRIAKTLDA